MIKFYIKCNLIFIALVYLFTCFIKFKICNPYNYLINLSILERSNLLIVSILLLIIINLYINLIRKILE